MIESYRAAVSETYIVVDMFAELHDVFGEVTNKFPLFKVLLASRRNRSTTTRWST